MMNAARHELEVDPVNVIVETCFAFSHHHLKMFNCSILQVVGSLTIYIFLSVVRKFRACVIVAP